LFFFFIFFFNFFSIFFNFFNKNYFLLNLLSPYVFFFILSGFIVSFYLVFISSTRVTSALGLSLFLFLFFLVFLINYFNNILSFFFIYEFFFLPSLVIVYYYSPNIRFLAALSYFTVWTQVGSLMLLFSIMYIYYYNLNINYGNSINFLPILPSFLVCLGLGIKVPI